MNLVARDFTLNELGEMCFGDKHECSVNPQSYQNAIVSLKNKMGEVQFAIFKEETFGNHRELVGLYNNNGKVPRKFFAVSDEEFNAGNIPPLRKNEVSYRIEDAIGHLRSRVGNRGEVIVFDVTYNRSIPSPRNVSSWDEDSIRKNEAECIIGDIVYAHNKALEVPVKMDDVYKEYMRVIKCLEKEDEIKKEKERLEQMKQQQEYLAKEVARMKAQQAQDARCSGCPHYFGGFCHKPSDEGAFEFWERNREYAREQEEHDRYEAAVASAINSKYYNPEYRRSHGMGPLTGNTEPWR